jgi:hypothetical protein
MPSVTRVTEDYIRTHPYARQALKNNIANYSKLSRRISQETQIKSIEAILIACRRYAQQLKGQHKAAEVMDLLKGTKLSMRDKIVVVILEPDVSFESILALQKLVREKHETMHVVRGANATTLITTEDFVELIKTRLSRSILKVTPNLVEVMLKSNRRLENVPGVISYVYSLLAENDVNIVETLSCWTDTILVISKDDLPRTLALLNF